MQTSHVHSTLLSKLPILLLTAFTAACNGLGDNKSTTHVVDVQVSANGCPELPAAPTVKPGDKVRIQIDSTDADSELVNKWAVAFTEGGLSCGCEVNNPENAFVCQIPASQLGPSRYCYSIYTKMSNTSYCELDPTIFVNRNLGGGVTEACEESVQIPSAIPPEMTCDGSGPVDPSAWL